VDARKSPNLWRKTVTRQVIEQALSRDIGPEMSAEALRRVSEGIEARRGRR